MRRSHSYPLYDILGGSISATRVVVTLLAGFITAFTLGSFIGYLPHAIKWRTSLSGLIDILLDCLLESLFFPITFAATIVIPWSIFLKAAYLFTALLFYLAEELKTRIILLCIYLSLVGIDGVICSLLVSIYS